MLCFPPANKWLNLTLEVISASDQSGRDVLLPCRQTLNATIQHSADCGCELFLKVTKIEAQILYGKFLTVNSHTKAFTGSDVTVYYSQKATYQGLAGCICTVYHIIYVQQVSMPQDRTAHSTTPSPPNRRLTASNLETPSSPVLFFQTTRKRIVAVPKLQNSPSPNAHLAPHSLPRASAVHTPPLPLKFLWRCCRLGCGQKNVYSTSTHFKFLRHVRGPINNWSCVPSYRTDRCQGCEHEACAICLLLQVEGNSEWKGVKFEKEFGETGDVGVWRRIGIWGEGRRFGIIEEQGKARHNDVLKDLESNGRVDQSRDRNCLKGRQYKQKASSR